AERDVHVERAEAPRTCRRDGGHGGHRGGQRRAARPHPYLVGSLVEAIRRQRIEVTPAEATCCASSQPAAPLRPMLGEHVAENPLGLRELVVVERERAVDAESELPRRACGDDLAVVEHAAGTGSRLMT